MNKRLVLFIVVIAFGVASLLYFHPAGLAILGGFATALALRARAERKRQDSAQDRV